MASYEELSKFLDDYNPQQQQLGVNSFGGNTPQQLTPYEQMMRDNYGAPEMQAQQQESPGLFGSIFSSSPAQQTAGDRSWWDDISTTAAGIDATRRLTAQQREADDLLWKYHYDTSLNDEQRKLIKDEYDRKKLELDKTVAEVQNARTALQQSNNLLGNAGSHVLSAGSSLESMQEQYKANLLGALGGAAVGSTILPGLGTVGGAWAGWRLANVPSAIRANYRDAEAGAMDAWHETMEKTGNKELAEQAYWDAMKPNLAYAALATIPDIAIGSGVGKGIGRGIGRILGKEVAEEGVEQAAKGAAGKLKKAADAVDLDFADKAGNWVAAKTGLPMLGTAANVGARMTPELLSEMGQEAEQGIATNAAVTSALHQYDPNANPDEGGWSRQRVLDWLNSEEGKETLVDTAASTALTAGLASAVGSIGSVVDGKRGNGQFDEFGNRNVVPAGQAIMTALSQHPEGEKWKSPDVDNDRVQCAAFVSHVYKNAGIQGISSVNGDELVRQFGDAYHDVESGYEPKAGDLINWKDHVGIYDGNGGYIARNSSGGVHHGSMEEARNYFGDVLGYGSVSDYTGTAPANFANAPQQTEQVQGQETEDAIAKARQDAISNVDEVLGKKSPRQIEAEQKAAAEQEAAAQYMAENQSEYEPLVDYRTAFSQQELAALTPQQHVAMQKHLQEVVKNDPSITVTGKWAEMRKYYSELTGNQAVPYAGSSLNAARPQNVQQQQTTQQPQSAQQNVTQQPVARQSQPVAPINTRNATTAPTATAQPANGRRVFTEAETNEYKQRLAEINEDREGLVAAFQRSGPFVAATATGPVRINSVNEIDSLMQQRKRQAADEIFAKREQAPVADQSDSQPVASAPAAPVGNQAKLQSAEEAFSPEEWAAMSEPQKKKIKGFFRNRQTEKNKSGGFKYAGFVNGSREEQIAAVRAKRDRVMQEELNTEAAASEPGGEEATVTGLEGTPIAPPATAAPQQGETASEPIPKRWRRGKPVDQKYVDMARRANEGDLKTAATFNKLPKGMQEQALKQLSEQMGGNENATQKSQSPQLQKPETGESGNQNVNAESGQGGAQENESSKGSEDQNEAEVKKTPAKRHFDSFKNKIDAAVKDMTFTQEKADELLKEYNRTLDILVNRKEVTQAEAEENRYKMQDAVKRGIILNDGRKLLKPQMRKWLDNHPFAYDKSKSREENIAAAQAIKDAFIKKFGISSTANVKPTEERKNLQKRILDYLYNIGIERRKRERKATLAIGYPAAGKSTVTKDLTDNKGYLLIDADEAKKLLPEFHGGALADIVHDESSDISRAIFRFAIEQGDNICYPTIGGKYESLKKKINLLHNDVAEEVKITDENGNTVPAYEVTLSFVDVPADKALNRIFNRFEETGRFDNPENIHNLVLKNPENNVIINLPEGARKNRLGSTETIPVDNEILKNYLRIKDEIGVERYEWIDNEQPMGASYGEMLRESGELPSRSDGRRESGPGESGSGTRSGDSGGETGESKAEKQKRVNRTDNPNQGGSSISQEFAPLTGHVRDTMIKKLNSALGKDKVQILGNDAFVDKLEEAYKESSNADNPAEEARRMVEPFRNGNNVVYGFAHNGKIYLNGDVMNANTPAHEFSHVWAKVAQTVNDGKLWEEGVDLLKQTPLWQEVASDPLYQNLNDDNAIASEVLARIVGSNNEKAVNDLAQGKDSAFRMRLSRWIKKMFNAVRDLLGISDGTLTYDEFVNMPLKALWDPAANKQFRQQYDQMLGNGQVEAMARKKAEAKPGNNRPGVVSTRNPNAVNATEDSLNELLIADYEALKKNEKLFKKDIEAMRTIEGLDVTATDPEQAAEQMIGRLVDNLLYVYRKVPKELRERAKKWYDGGRRMAEVWGNRYGISPQSAAGVIAVLSPQKNWYENVSLAERILDCVYGKNNMAWDDAMTKAATVKKNRKDVAGLVSQELAPELEKAKGKTLQQLIDNGDYTAAAIWIRAYDKAYNEKYYRVITPEGGTGEYMLNAPNKEGVRTKTAIRWQGYGPISKAISIAANPSHTNVSYQVGNAHKVRNFYNNLYDPLSPLFATIDTHAVGAALMHAVSGQSRVVKMNFQGAAGAGGSDVLGIAGTYPIYFEAYRRAAEKVGVLPREMQSITWEAIRNIYPESIKDTEKETAEQEKIRAEWRKVDAAIKAGADEKTALAKARKKVYNIGAKGKPMPQFAWENTPADIAVGDTYDRSNVNIKKANAKGTGVQIAFEVAPDPNNEELTKRWENNLTDEEKLQTSVKVAEKVVPKVLDEFDVTGGFQVQVGGYEGKTNPSLMLTVSSPNAAIPISKMLGYVLNQDSMMVISPQKISGANPVGSVQVKLPDGWGQKEIAAFYDKLWELKDKKGNHLVGGHSTSNGVMTIMNYSGYSDEKLAQKIANIAPEYETMISTMYSAFPERKDYGYAISDEGAVDGARVDRRANRIRSEAAEELERELSEAERRNVSKTTESVGRRNGSRNGEVKGKSAGRVLGGTQEGAGVQRTGNLVERPKPPELQALYNTAEKNFPEIKDKAVSERVKDGIRQTVDFGKHEGDILESASENRLRQGVPELQAGAGPVLHSRKVETGGMPVYSEKGFSLTRELINEGYVDLTGRKVNSISDLAEIAQVLRHPGYEKLHYVYVKDGEVVYHETTSTFLPAVVKAQLKGESMRQYEERMRENLRKYGADTFYLLHNHPDGDITPSQADFNLTDFHKSYSAPSGVTFGGHIILDTTKCSVLTDGKTATEHAIPENAQIHYADKADVPHITLGTKLGTSDALIEVSKKLADQSKNTVFFTDTNDKIRSVVQLPDEFTQMDERQMMRYLRWVAKKEYGTWAYIVTSDKNAYKAMLPLYRQGSGVYDILLTGEPATAKGQGQYRYSGRFNAYDFFGIESDASSAHKVLGEGVKTEQNTAGTREGASSMPELQASFARETKTELDLQKAEVRKRYEGTDQWLKAPDGSDTNLTEDQWITARTPAFKNWFGDWENDPANASKVLDENGEPLVVYHGTNANFKAFKRHSHFGGNIEQALDRLGYYHDQEDFEDVELSELEKRATADGNKVMRLFLNIRNPLVLDVDFGSWTKEDYDKHGVSIEGHDGVFYENWHEGKQERELEEGEKNNAYIAFSPNQIKDASGHNAGFDGQNNNIYASVAESTIPEVQRSVDELADEVKKAFPSAKTVLREGQHLIFTMPNGSKIAVDIQNQVALSEEEAAKARKAHGKNNNQPIRVNGYTDTIDKNAAITLAQNGDKGTAFHEAFHTAWNLVMTPKEKAAMLQYFKDKTGGKDVQEAMADAYRDWQLARQRHQGTVFGKLFQKIQDFAKKMARILTGTENVHDVMRKLAQGEVWNRESQNTGSRTDYLVTNNKITGDTKVPVIDISGMVRTDSTDAKARAALAETLYGKEFKIIGSEGIGFTKKTEARRVNGKKKLVRPGDHLVRGNGNDMHSPRLVNEVRQKALTAVEDLLNNAIYIEKHPDSAHNTNSRWIDLYAAARNGDRIYPIHLQAKEKDPGSGEFVVGKAMYYNLTKKEALPPTAKNKLMATETGKASSAISIADLLQNVKDEKGRPYVTDGKLNYDPALSSQPELQAKQYSISSAADTALNKAEKYVNRNVRQANTNTPEGRTSQIYANTGTKTKAQNIVETLKNYKDKFYREWVDKNHMLHYVDDFIEKTTGKKLSMGESIYYRAQMMRALANGAADTLIQGNEQSMNALRERIGKSVDPKDTARVARAKELKAKFKNVTMKDVLETISNKEMDQKHPDYLKQHGINSWREAFSNYIGARRLLELIRLVKDKSLQNITHSQKEFKEFIDKHPEYEVFRPKSFSGKWREQVQAMAKKEPVLAEQMAKELAKEYKLPKGISRADLEATVNNAPKEFNDAAQKFYQLQENLLILMEDGHLIPQAVHEKINSMYKEYCPLVIDYSDTAPLDAQLDGFISKDGAGIANVGSMLKHVLALGSEHGLKSPLESTYNSIQMLTNRAERNKVGVHFVRMVENNKDLADSGILTKVEGSKAADPKNCVFTVMMNGEKVAYKTTQDMYGPIVGFDEGSAGIVFNLAANTASWLRAGATMSPSFIIRNFIRDTIFAGISSRNNFIPIIDSWKGMYAYMHNKELRGEFDAMGITSFNFWGSTDNMVKSMDEIMGDTKIKNPIDFIKWLFGHFREASEIVEASTRMGEYMKARKAGKSMEEAAYDARDVTLDFSRSGVSGQQYNRIVPFFNACIQGGDKMIRLIANKRTRAQTMRLLGQYVLLPSVLLWAINHDEPWYEELDPQIKMNNWVFPGGIRIPKPQEAGVIFGSGVEAILDRLAQKDPAAMKNWAKSVRDVALPNMIPTIGLPMLEWWTNYSLFREKPLEGNRLKRLPAELRYNANTAEASKAIGSVTGLSPVKLDNAVRGYTGTMGMFAWQLFDYGFEEKRNLPSKNLRERAFIRDFAINDMNMNRTSEDFYNLVETAQQQHAGYGKKGKPTPAVKAINRAMSNVSKQNKDIQAITNNRHLTPDQKRQLIDRKREMIKTIQKATLKRYRDKFDV